MFEKLKDGEFCPLIQKACVTHKCKWYKKIMGLDPQTGQQIEGYDCAVGLLPILLIENANQTRHVGAEVNEVRKETVKQRFMMLPEEGPPHASHTLLPEVNHNGAGPERSANGE